MVCVPILEKVLKLPNKHAHATAIAVIFPLSFISAIIYVFNGYVKTFPLLIVGIGVILGGTLGSFCLKWFPPKAIRIIFAVIMLALYGLLYMGAFSEIGDKRVLKIVCAGFFLARCLSGIGAVSFPLAKGDGMLFLFADRAHRRIVKGALYVQSAGCVLGMFLVSFGTGAAVMAAALAAFWWYYRRCRREFGGITGDTAGYFVVLCELCMAVSGAAADVMFRWM